MLKVIFHVIKCVPPPQKVLLVISNHTQVYEWKWSVYTLPTAYTYTAVLMGGTKIQAHINGVWFDELK